ncbi:MAG: DUF2924 domain-containing protein [Pseudomonadota bacterium]
MAGRSTGWRPEPVASNQGPTSSTASDIEALARATAAELRKIWQTRRGTLPPPTLSARIMRHALAWDLQAEGQGGEAPSLRRQWQGVMKRRADGVGAEAAVSGLPAKAAPTGTRLLKSWAGVSHEVIMTDDGVVWNGTTYSSLSAVARAMTGTPRNGPKFFGLREKGL